MTQKKITEQTIQQLVKLEASKTGARLWRNNVGATYTQKGSFIRYGLANDSHAVNSKMKSADLIGIKPIVITADMVGCVIGQFISREIKSPQWKFDAKSDRDSAQMAWANLIISLGGDACFVTSEGSL